MLWLIASLPLHAQLQLESGVYNRTSLRTPSENPSGLPPVGANLPPTGSPTLTPQYSNVVESSGGVAPSAAAGDGTIRLQRSSLGTTFASGVPRYNFGDVILPPSVIYDSLGQAKVIGDPETYWRTEPLRPAETIFNPGGAPMSPDYGTGTSAAIPALDEGVFETFYYSPHAKEVFANTPGQASITWVSRLPDPAFANRYVIYSETFAVAAGTSDGVGVRPLFWTEKSFEAPEVDIPSGRIETVKPIFSNIFPESVTEEYTPPGQIDPNSTPEQRTVWFEKFQSSGKLRAYNVTGRLLVEYLGPLQGDGTHQFIGIDVISVERSLPATTLTVNLGNEVRPSPDDPSWLPSPISTTSSTDSAPLYGTESSSSGVLRYFAERENDVPERTRFFWLDPEPIALAAPGSVASGVTIAWPVALHQYAFVWPTGHEAYAFYTVGPAGSSLENGTGLSFSGNSLPSIVYQDSISDNAIIDNASQRLLVNLASDPDSANRSLLKFTGSNGGVWYVRIYSQSQDRAGFLEPDGQPRVSTTATVGQRITPPPGYSKAGYISAGSSFDTASYQDPFTAGIQNAEKGAILPVNALPNGSDKLTIRWFQKIPAPSAEFKDFYVSSKVGIYTLQYPDAPRKIILAANTGSGPLSGGRQSGTIYHQPDPARTGYNPNEEHAIMSGGVVYALRDDLNQTAGSIYGDASFTSRPLVLLRYTSQSDGIPAMEVFEVQREDDTHSFDYPVTAGTMLNSPLPLPYLPQAINPQTGRAWNDEVPAETGTDPPTNPLAPALYHWFTFQDRKGFHWIYRGPHESGSQPSMGMQFHYPMRADFHIPGLASQPPQGTPLPYLRPLDPSGKPIGDPVTGTPLTIHYRPVWPENPPELQLAETLGLPKRGLPAVRGQSSAEILYQQSTAAAATIPSAVLHDPTRSKSILLNDASVGLDTLPSSLKTDTRNGKTFFQLAQPHLQQRFYFDPNLGDKGGLTLLGEFHSPTTGEAYYDLNTLSAADLAALKSLVSDSDKDKASWDRAIDNLSTTMETFVEDPARPGTYIVNTSRSTKAGVSDLPVPVDSDSAVDSYALTATGRGTGFVSLLVQDGEAFTETGEPITVHVFKITDRLYQGDLKAIPATNPLDEQVTLRHSGDFAAEPGNYEFDWRFATAVNGSAPPTYTFGQSTVVGNTDTQWNLLTSPQSLPSQANPLTYSAITTINRDSGTSLSINTPPDYDQAKGLPGRILKLATDLPPQPDAVGNAIFSASLRQDEGFILYINNLPQLAYNLPPGINPPGGLPATLARAGLDADGLSLQFEIDSTRLAATSRIEVAIYSASTSLPSPASSVNLRLAVQTRKDNVSESSQWTELGAAGATLQNIVVLGGDAASPLGNPLLIFQDTFHTVRYRPIPNSGMASAEWSDWTSPQLVESWVKRVLEGINPFDQRVTDLFNNPISTDVSILTQAGKRWEGDVALNLDNIDEFGLIEIYETVLNRVKAQSIDAGYNDAGVNQTLLLAAGYLNDLYMSLGNEAYDDAMNPTLQVDTANGTTDISSSRFAFEGQVPNLLEETLALLRGRDDFLSPGTTVAPAYNRLYWNYTGGILSGEAIYASNYQIYEKSDDPAADGDLNEDDAARLFPQGHGDAYGHYLTALTGYYKLLNNDFFTWVPQSESVDVAGQPVSIDYYDERKFAAAAAAVARSGYQILDFTARLDRTSIDNGWSSFADLDSAGNPTQNPSTGESRHWGIDDWASSTSQGTYFNWLSANAMLPEKSPEEGIRKIDRSTVPELNELVSIAENVSTLVTGFQDHLNSLGLPADAIAFDISPAEVATGKTHFEQIFERATSASVNAKHAFTQASLMSNALRGSTSVLDEYIHSVNEQEKAYEYQLKDLLGTPYAGDIGPGRIYEQGYNGPDLYNYYFIDPPPQLVDLSRSYDIEVRTPLQTGSFTTWTADEAWLRLNPDYAGGVQFTTRTYRIDPARPYQFAADKGSRAEPGQIQQALRDIYLAEAAVRKSSQSYFGTDLQFARSYSMISEIMDDYSRDKSASDDLQDQANRKAATARTASVRAAYLSVSGDFTLNMAGAVSEAFPDSTFDFAFAGKSASLVAATLAAQSLQLGAVASELAAASLENEADDLLQQADDLAEDIAHQAAIKRTIVEYEKLYYQLLEQSNEVEASIVRLQSALERVSVILAKSNRIQNDRESFRRRAAATIEKFRNGDVLYRDMRHEFLEQYKSLFNLAQTYSFLAAKAYDYETGLLGTPLGKGLLGDILGTYSLGEFSGSNPVRTGIGDAGLASALAVLRDEYSVAKGRLGINNPDRNGTLFSLRHELFRIKTDSTTSDDDLMWRQILQQRIKSDLRNDPDVLNHCANLVKSNNTPVPGIVIPFSTTIQAGINFFGWPLAAGDHVFTQSAFATKISSVGVVFSGYIGMDPWRQGTPNAGGPANNQANALSATPYVYLIPCGLDLMRAPALGDSPVIRSWDVQDQALPLPLNIGGNPFGSTQVFTPQGSLAEQFWIPRRHQAFRAVDDGAYFYNQMPSEFTSSRLVGRSVWNTQWKLVIPGYSLLNDERAGLDAFINSVSDIELFLRTYSHSGN